MKLFYRVMFVLFCGFLFIQQAQAQDTLVVEWYDGEKVIKNALRDAILADTTDRPEGRVYKLLRSGLYWLTDPVENEADRPLVIVGETKAPQGEDDYGPPVIQRVLRDDQSNPSGQMFSCFGDLTLKNTWLLGRTSSGSRGSYEQIKLLGDGRNYTFDNVIFDDCAWHFLGPDAPNVDFIATNCKFRNLHGDTQIWEGLGVRFEAGADTVIFENNTFLNIGFTPFQSEAAPINYFLVNHNTFVNIGRTFQAGALWKEIYVANNVFVNCFFQGDDYDMYSDPDRDDPYTGFFGISELPSEYGTNFDRQIYFGYNSFWRDPAFETFYASVTPNPIRSQPLINDTTQGWFDSWADDGNMKFENNWTGDDANPNLTVYPLDTPGLLDSIIANVQTLLVDNAGSGAPLYIWDPGWNGDPTLNNFPLPEDFSYSNTNLVGTDGLHLGDLNWFPADKATFLANKAQYTKDIKDKVGAPELDILATVEAEEATPSGDATEELAEGLLYYQMDGGGWIQWTFDLVTGAQYDLNIQTHMRGNSTRGQRILINGANQANGGIHDCFGYGEYIWDVEFNDGEPCENPHNGMDPNAWQWTRITQDAINEAGALTFLTGSNVIRIEASWGYQNFASIQLLEPGTDNVVIELSAADAEFSGVFPGVEGAAWAPSGFKSVALGAGGAISFDLDLPYDAVYMCRIFYAADGMVMGQLEMDNNIVDPAISFTDTSDVFTAQFAATAGNRTFKLSAAAGGVNIDYVQLIAFVPATGLREADNVPVGFRLEQNYPNPFNPSTKIHFELGKLSQVSLTVYNVLGQQVAKLVNNQRLPKGTYIYEFDAARLASGVYFYRLEAENFTSQRKMILLK